jgi:hypothetical protein
MKSSNCKIMAAQELKYRIIMGHACAAHPNLSVVRYTCANVDISCLQFRFRIPKNARRYLRKASRSNVGQSCWIGTRFLTCRALDEAGVYHDKHQLNGEMQSSNFTSKTNTSKHLDFTESIIVGK